MPRRSISLLALLLGVGLAVLAQEQQPAGQATPAASPRTVTLEQTEITVAAALAELRKQTGAVVVADETGLKDRKITLQLNRATFWQALDRIASAAGAKVQLAASDRTVSLVPRPEGDDVPPTSYSGDFRVRVAEVVARRQFDSRRSSLALTLEVAWAPTLRPLFLDTRVRRLQVVGGDGKPLPAGEDGGSLASVDGRSSSSLELNLPGVPRTMQALQSVEGQLLVVAPSKMLSFRYDADLQALKAALADGALRRLVLDEVACTIARVVAEADRWSVQVRLNYPAGGRALESFQAGSLVANNELVLVSRDGKRALRPTAFVVDEVSPRRALVTYHFRDSPARPLGNLAGWRPLYSAPARIVDVPFTFTFKSVPLP